MLNRAFNYMQLTFEELPMGKEQLLYAKAQVGASKLSIVYTSSNGIQAPSFAGYQPAPFDPRSYGPLPPQPFYNPNRQIQPFQMPSHAPVHMPPRSPDFGGRRPSRASVDQPSYTNRMQTLHNAGMPHTTTGPAPDDTMIVGRVPLDDQPVQFGRGGSYTPYADDVHTSVDDMKPLDGDGDF